MEAVPIPSIEMSPVELLTVATDRSELLYTIGFEGIEEVKGYLKSLSIVSLDSAVLPLNTGVALRTLKVVLIVPVVQLLVDGCVAVIVTVPGVFTWIFPPTMDATAGLFEL